MKKITPYLKYFLFTILAYLTIPILYGMEPDRRIDVSTVSPMQTIYRGLLGSTAGTIAAIGEKPLKYCFNRDSAGLTIEPSPSTWYRGIIPYMAARPFINGIQFGFYQAFSRFVESSDHPLSIRDRILAASGGGIASAVVGSPIELIATVQERTASTFFETVRRILHHHGIPGLYRNVLPVMVRNGGFTASYAALGPIFTETYSPLNNKFAAELAGGLTAGIIGAVAMTPPQLIQAILERDAHKAERLAIVPTIRKVFQEEGLMVLGRGLKWRVAQSVVSITIMNSIISFLEEHFGLCEKCKKEY